MKIISIDLKQYKGKKVAMHCPEEWQAILFCQFLNNLGLCWSAGNSYNKTNYWQDNTVNTVYYFNEGSYGTVASARMNGYRILEISDYILDDGYDEPKGTTQVVFNGKFYECNLPDSLLETLKKTEREEDDRADKLIRDLRAFARKNGERGVDRIGYHIIYDYAFNKVSFMFDNRPTISPVVFTDREIAEQAMDEFNNELIWYFTKYLR